MALSFTSYDDLLDTLTPRVLDLIEVLRREAPASINETARVVARDAKNVHEELSRLANWASSVLRKTGKAIARSSGSTNLSSPPVRFRTWRHGHWRAVHMVLFKPG